MKKSQLRQIIKEQINARKVHWKQCGSLDTPTTHPDTDAMTIGNNIPSPGDQFMSSNNIPAEITQVAPADPNATIINYDYHVCPAGTVTNIPTGTGDSNLNPIDTINIDKVPSIYDKPEKMGDRMNEIKKNKTKRIQLRETALVNLINRVINEQQTGYSYFPNYGGNPGEQCWACHQINQWAALNNYGCGGMNCSGACIPDTFSPDMECMMCMIWRQCKTAMGPPYLPNNFCNLPCSASFGYLWEPNKPCYRCDKFGNVEKLENYSHWGTTQGPCPPGYTKEVNPCMKADDNFVRTPDDREQTDSPVLFQPSGEENIKGDVEEINESHLKRLIHRVINEQRTVTSYTHTPPSGSCNKDCGQLGTARFKQKAQGKPCNWLKKRSTTLNQKITTKQPGSCQSKRIDCKLQVIHSLIQQQRC